VRCAVAQVGNLTSPNAGLAILAGSPNPFIDKKFCLERFPDCTVVRSDGSSVSFKAIPDSEKTLFEACVCTSFLF
jgi:hypothetical protein